MLPLYAENIFTDWAHSYRATQCKLQFSVVYKATESGEQQKPLRIAYWIWNLDRFQDKEEQSHCLEYLKQKLKYLCI